MIIVATTRAPQAIGPYSQAVRFSGTLVFTSGQIPLDPATGQDRRRHHGRTDRTGAAQSDRRARSGRRVADRRSMKITVFLKNMADFAEMNAVYARFFPHDPPARSAVEVARLPKDVLVEIECLALSRLRLALSRSLALPRWLALAGAAARRRTPASRSMPIAAARRRARPAPCFVRWPCPAGGSTTRRITGRPRRSSSSKARIVCEHLATRTTGCRPARRSAENYGTRLDAHAAALPRDDFRALRSIRNERFCRQQRNELVWWLAGMIAALDGRRLRRRPALRRGHVSQISLCNGATVGVTVSCKF